MTTAAEKKRRAKYMREYYQRFPEKKAKHRKYVMKDKVRRKLIAQEFVNQYRVKCLYCGERERCCLSFHHKSRRRKKFGIAYAVTSGYSPEKIAKEMRHCVCVCENCHRRIHAGILKLS